MAIYFSSQTNTSFNGDQFALNNTDGNHVVATAGNIDNSLVFLGSGDGDDVSASASLNTDLITFGNGSGDHVGASTIANTAITFGTGISATLTAFDTINDALITFGTGNSDTLSAGGVNSTGQVLSNDIVLFGKGTSNVLQLYGSASNDRITFGDGANDTVLLNGDVTNDKISLGNGGSDAVTITGVNNGGTNDSLIVGNGNGDNISLNSQISTSTIAGGVTIITGTGNSDAVNVDNGIGRTGADTFGFALGTGSTALQQTTVAGALANDHVAVGTVAGIDTTSSGSLGAVIHNDGDLGSGITSVNALITYLSAHGGLAKGNTYTADNGTDTFIVTDTQSNHTGGVELVGVFEHSTITNHVLTLGA